MDRSAGRGTRDAELVNAVSNLQTANWQCVLGGSGSAAAKTKGSRGLSRMNADQEGD